MTEAGLTRTEPLAEPAPAAPAVSQRQIAAFWLPLAASWLMMALEGPIASGTLSRLPEPARMLAAFGITFSLAVTIESPVIMLLATSTALARDRQAYAKIKNFTLALMLITTLLLAAVGWTPLYDLVVRQAIGAPGPIADAAQPGLRIMLLWSAVIAWRRFRQGILIRNGEPRWVGYGTLVRLVVTGITAVGLGVWGGWPGVWVGASALMAGVLAESAFAHLVSIPFVARIPLPQTQAADYRPLTYGALLRYHAPLAATSLLVLFAQPIIGAALARSPHPESALAAWPLVFGLLLIFRGPGLALPEVTIAQLARHGLAAPVRRFALTVGIVTVGVMAAVAFTPLASLYLRGLIGAPDPVADAAIPGIQFGVVVPLMVALQGWQRGRLMHLRTTGPVTLAMLINLITLAGALLAGSALRLPGVALAGGSLSLAMTVECLVLAWGGPGKKDDRRRATADR